FPFLPHLQFVFFICAFVKYGTKDRGGVAQSPLFLFPLTFDEGKTFYNNSERVIGCIFLEIN
ncbi:TPA: hypothetical protein ACKZ02_000210, partial [Streptococcus pyogenes]